MAVDLATLFKQAVQDQFGPAAQSAQAWAAQAEPTPAAKKQKTAEQIQMELAQAGQPVDDTFATMDAFIMADPTQQALRAGISQSPQSLREMEAGLPPKPAQKMTPNDPLAFTPAAAVDPAASPTPEQVAGMEEFVARAAATTKKQAEDDNAEVVIRDETGERRFKNKALADAFLARKADAAKSFAQRQQNVNARAMMKGLARDVRMGNADPNVAAVTAVRIAQSLDPTTSPKVDENGNPTPEFAAANPTAAKIIAEANYMRGRIGLGEKEVDSRNLATTTFAGVQRAGIEAGAETARGQQQTARDIAGIEADTTRTVSSDTNRTQKEIAAGEQGTRRDIATDTNRTQRDIAADTNATKRTIAETQESGATSRAKIGANAAVRTTQIQEGQATKRAIIDADARKYGIDKQHAQNMRQLDITGKMTDAQIKNMEAETGLKSKQIDNDHTARMRGLDVAEKEFTSQHATQIALGRMDADSRNYATEVTREKYGMDFADAAADRAVRREEMSWQKQLSKDQLQMHKENQKFEQKFKTEEQKFAKKRFEADSKLAKTDRQIARLESQAKIKALDSEQANQLARLQLDKQKLESDIKLNESALEAQRAQVERARIENKSLEAQAKQAEADAVLFPKDKYPDVGDRVTARTKWIADNKDKIVTDGSVMPPAVQYYLDDLRKEGESLYDQSWSPFTSDDTEFEVYATNQLGAALGDDRLAQQLVSRYVNGGASAEPAAAATPKTATEQAIEEVKARQRGQDQAAGDAQRAQADTAEAQRIRDLYYNR